MKVIGLISGTSADGIDAALLDIQGEAPKLKIELLAFKTYRYPKEVRSELLSLSQRSCLSLERLVQLDSALGRLFARAARRLALAAKIPLSRIDLIGSHGQTICHSGKKGTLQVGDPSVIAECTSTPTMANFRRRDVAAGGEGAPLAPFLHWVLFHPLKEDVCVLNIGGIANVTFVPANGRQTAVRAFDTGPGNMIMDALVRHFTCGKEDFDRNGSWASRGEVVEPLLRDWSRHPYFKKRPPKSAGREEFGWDWISRMVEQKRWRSLSRYDWVATATSLTVLSIAESIEHFHPKNFRLRKMIVGGGGVHHRVLMRMLRERLSRMEILSFEEIGWNSDAIEAMAFALLAYEAYHGRVNHMPQVTGAKHPVVLGELVHGGRLL